MANVLYSGSLTERDICSRGNVTLIPGVYNLIGEVVVKADEKIGLGRGSAATQGDAIGRFFALFKDTEGNEIENGKLRCQLVSSQDMPIGSRPIALDLDLVQLMNGEVTPSERYPLPFDNTLLTKDRKFQFYIKNCGEEAITLDAKASKAIMDVTKAIV